jgi:D-beta-D-heptose 7-phosphate kinase/D-beta-D-heptose 1-phosphate adenosyltransferase
MRALAEAFVARAGAVRVLVAGDCMLDAYISGEATRISPEAPVPVVAVTRRRNVAGGAANVAANVRSMGAQAVVGGLVGADESAGRLREVLWSAGVSTDALIESAARSTTTKTRITAAGQQIVRFDEETRAPLSADESADLRARISRALDSTDVCIISDYAKGVVDAGFSHWLIETARQRRLPVIVDPKSADLARYAGATVVTPNAKEAAAAAGLPTLSDAELSTAAIALLAAIFPAALLVTRGEHGMTLFEPAGSPFHLPARVNEVADVTGAGDTVVAALAIALGIGLTLPQATEIANTAAAVAVSHHGTWAVRGEEILAAAQ